MDNIFVQVAQRLRKMQLYASLIHVLCPDRKSLGDGDPHRSVINTSNRVATFIPYLFTKLYRFRPCMIQKHTRNKTQWVLLQKTPTGFTWKDTYRTGHGRWAKQSEINTCATSATKQAKKTTGGSKFLWWRLLKPMSTKMSIKRFKTTIVNETLVKRILVVFQICFVTFQKTITAWCFQRLLVNRFLESYTTLNLVHASVVRWGNTSGYMLKWQVNYTMYAHTCSVDTEIQATKWYCNSTP